MLLYIVTRVIVERGTRNIIAYRAPYNDASNISAEESVPIHIGDIVRMIMRTSYLILYTDLKIQNKKPLKSHYPKRMRTKQLINVTCRKRNIDDDTFKGVIETDAVCGCCSFYKKDVLELSGLGDEDFCASMKASCGVGILIVPIDPAHAFRTSVRVGR